MEQYTYEEYILTLVDTGETGEYGKARVAYRLEDGNGVIFEGNDMFVCRKGEDVVGPQTAGDLLCFLTCQVGDVEDDYFTDYTPRQIVFRDNEAESLVQWGYDLDGGYTY